MCWRGYYLHLGILKNHVVKLFLTARIFGGAYFPVVGPPKTVFGSQTGNIAITPLGHFGSPLQEESSPLFRLACLRAFENGLWTKKRLGKQLGFLQVFSQLVLNNTQILGVEFQIALNSTPFGGRDERSDSS